MRRRVGVLVPVMGLAACAASAPAPPPLVPLPAAPSASPAPPEPAPSAEPAAASSASVAPPAAPAPAAQKLAQARFADAMQAARTRGLEALAAAGLGAITLDSAMHPTRESDEGGCRWRFAAMNEAPCTGCQESTGGEQVGWLLVGETDGAVQMDALGQTLGLAEWQRLRQRETQIAARIGRLPLIRAFCRWAAAQPGVQGCVHWVEEAPPAQCPPAAPACGWRVYVGTAQATHASRYFTLVIEDKTGRLLVDELGQLLPAGQWRKNQPF